MIQNDTIIALATPAGVGAISVIRLSGENAINIVDANFKSIKNDKSLKKQKTHSIHLGHIIKNDIVLDSLEKYRLTVDTAADYTLMSMLFNFKEKTNLTGVPLIRQFMASYPWLIDLNQHVQQKEIDA